VTAIALILAALQTFQVEVHAHTSHIKHSKKCNVHVTHE